MSRSAVTQRLRMTSDPINSSYFIKLCLSDTFKQLDLPLIVFTCKYSMFTVYTCKKAVPRNSFKKPPNNPCRNRYSSRTVQSLREASQLCCFYSHMLSIWNTVWLLQVCTWIRKMFNLVLKNPRSGQTSPLLLQGSLTTSISFKAHYYPFSTGLSTQAGPKVCSDLVGHWILPSCGSDHRGEERISPTWPNSGVWGEWQRRESKALSSWVEAIRIRGSNGQDSRPLLGPGEGDECTV